MQVPPMPHTAPARYLRTMPKPPIRRFARSLALLPALGLLAGGCLAYPADGSVATPAPPGESGASRLPQLLSQLQGGAAGVEIFSETPESQVLAAQDAEPGKVAPSPTSTVAGDRTTPTPTPTTGSTATPTPRPATATPTPAGSPTPTPTAGSPTPTPISTPTPTPSPTSTPTPTPTPSPPTEGATTPTPPPTEG